MFKLLIVCPLILLAFESGALLAQDGDSWKEQVLREAPKAWERYSARAKGLQGVYSFAIRFSNSKDVDKDRYEIKQRDGHTLYLEQTGKVGYLKVVNPKYAFALRRPSADRPWAMTGVGKSFYKPSSIDDPDYWALVLNRLPYTFGAVGGTLQVTLADPGFSIRKAAPLPGGEQRLVKVDFDYSPPKDPARMPLRSGSVVLDPEHYWVIRRFDVQTLWGKEVRTEAGTFDYHDAGDGFPILKKILSREQIPSRNAHVEYTWEFDLQERDVAEDEFRLSAFGFREPRGVTWDGGSRWYLWFILLAGISLALGGYFRYRVQRRKRMLT